MMPEERKEPSLEPDPLSLPTRKAPAAKQKRGGGFGWLWTLLLLLSILPGIVLLLKWVPPPVTAFMLMSETKPVHYQWVPAERIADVARKAVVASEDQKFWTHQGFDMEAIEKALAQNEKVMKRKRGRIRGGSTISQQTAKNLFLWSGGGYFRKAVEATITVLMETWWGKDRILDVYLNVAEFGPGVYGIEAASQLFFGKAASALSAQEAAQLAAVLPNPKRWSATKPGPYVQKRTRWILGQMGYGHAPADEPEPLPLDNGEEMPALDPWQNNTNEDAPQQLPDDEPLPQGEEPQAAPESPAESPSEEPAPPAQDEPAPPGH